MGSVIGTAIANYAFKSATAKIIGGIVLGAVHKEKLHEEYY